MNEDSYSRLRRLAEGATPGPWALTEDLIEHDEFDDLMPEPERVGWLIEQGALRAWVCDDGNEDDAEFIATADPTTVLGLFDRIDRLEGWKAQALSVLNDWDKAWVAAGHPGPLGSSKALATAAEIERLIGRDDV